MIIVGSVLALPVLNERFFKDKEALKKEHFEQGKEYYTQGNYREAVLEFKNALQLDPQYAYAQYELGKTYLKLNRVQDAYSHLSQSVSKNSGIIDAQILLGNLFVSAGNIDLARNKADLLIKAAPEKVDGYLLQSRVAANGDRDFEKALEWVDKALEIDPDHMDARIQLGRVHFQSSNIELAETTLKEVVAKHDTAYGAFVALANFYRATADSSRAKATLLQAMDRHETEPRVYIALSDYYQGAGDKERVADILHKGLEKIPDNAQLHYTLGFFYTVEEDTKNLEHFQKALAANSDLLPAKKQLAYALSKKGEYDRSDSLVNEILSDIPQDQDALYIRGKNRVARSQFSMAIDDLERVSLINPRYVFAPYTPDLQYFLGLAYHREGMYGEAYEALGLVGRGETHYNAAQLLLAEVGIRLGRSETAIEAADAVLAEDPDNIQAALFQGQAMLNSGDPQLVKKGLEQTIKGLRNILVQNPDNLQAAILLGQSLAGVGKVDEAEKVLSENAAKHPDSLPVRLALGRHYQQQAKWDQAEKVLLETVAKFGSSAAAHLALGDYYAAVNKADEAEKAYMAGLDVAQDKGQVYFSLGRFYGAQNLTRKAVEAFQKAIEATPEPLVAKKHLAYQLLKGGAVASADTVIAEILQTASDDMEGLYLRGRSMLMRGRPQDAIRDLERVYVARANFLFSTEQIDLPLSYYLAQAYYLTGQLTNARSAIRQVPPFFARATLVRQLDAEISLYLGDHQSTLELMGAELKRNPDSVNSLILLARAQAQEGKMDAALKSFDKILAIDPDNTKAKFGVGLIYANKKKYDEAISLFEKVLEQDPERIEALAHLTDILLLQEKPEKAVQRTKQQLEKAPENAAMHQLLGSLYYSQGQVPEAVQHFTKAVELNPAYWQAHFMLGNYHQLEGRLEEAIASYEKTLEYFPQHVTAANNLAWLYAETGSNLEKAWNLAEMARERNPNNPNILDTLGWIYFKTGSYQRAINLLEESIQLSPDTPTLYYHLARAQEQSGDAASARSNLEKALKLDSEFAEADSARIILAALEEAEQPTEEEE